MKVYLWKHPDAASRLLAVAQGCACVLDGLIIVLSAGFCGSGYAIAVSRYRAGRHIRSLKRGTHVARA
jgi:hypothetical protein